MRSVVVVLPASMWAMIPMFRVFWSENFLVIDRDPLTSSRCRLQAKKLGPSGPRAQQVVYGPVASLSARGLHLALRLRGGHARTPASTRDATPTIAEGFAPLSGLQRGPQAAPKGLSGVLAGRLDGHVLEHRSEALEH